MMYLDYFLVFLSILGLILYGYTAFINKKKIKVDVFGEQKNISTRALILMCFLDGIVVGAILFYLIVKIFSIPIL